MNDHDPIIDSARSWLRYAEGDLDSASKLSAGAGAPRHVCWLSQQASEKALKAAFVLEGKDFPHIHDLDRLRNSLPEGWPVKKTHPSLTRMTGFVTVSRYPGDWPELTDADASYALSVARSICDSVGAEFGRRGVL